MADRMTDASDHKRDFFVSFNQADRAWATWIAWTLEGAGYSVFFQDWDFKGNFVLEMDKAHTQSRRSIAVLSSNYLTSRFTAPEWAARFAQDATSEHDLLIPVRVHPCELEGLLAQIIYVDLVGCSEAAARDKLIKRVEGIRLKPDEPPLFPGEISHAAVPERPAFPATAPMGGRWDMTSAWSLIAKPSNRQILSWIGGGIVAVAVGAWAVVTYVWPAQVPDKTVCAQQGIALGGDVSGSTVTNTVSGSLSSGPCVETQKNP